MKKYIIGWIIIIFLPGRGFCQSQELQQLELDVQKLAQLRAILSDLKEGYQILSNGYNTIQAISKGNFGLHSQFLDGLLQVSPAVRNYPKITSIIHSEISMANQTRDAILQYHTSGEFTGGEISYITKVYARVLNQAFNCLSDLTTLLTPGVFRMSDEERLSAIERIWSSTLDQQNFITDLTNQTKLLGIQRARETLDISEMNQLYLIKP